MRPGCPAPRTPPPLARRDALVVCGFFFQLLALHLAPVSVVQPALVLGLGLLVVLAEHRLGERIGRRDRLAVAAAAAGVFLIAVGGAADESSTAGHPATVLAAFGAVASSCSPSPTARTVLASSYWPPASARHGP